MTTQQAGASRIERHLFARLNHATYRNMRQVFCDLNLLCHTEVDIDGFFAMRFDMPDLPSEPGDDDGPARYLTGHPIHDLRTLNAQLGAGVNLDASGLKAEFDLSLPFPMFLKDMPQYGVDRTYLLKLLRCFRVRPDIGDVAVCYLLAHALEGWGLQQFMALSRRRSELMIVRTDFEGLQDILIRILSEQRLFSGHVVLQPLEQWGATTFPRLNRTRSRFRQARACHQLVLC